MAQRWKVTVLMSVYNGGESIRTAVESILNQTYSNFEFLIVDDGSTDDTPDVLRSLVTEDSRIRVVRNRSNLGLGGSLNRGVAEARGELVARMDADDISHPERLERQVEFLTREPSVDVVGTQAVDIDSAGNLLASRSAPMTHQAICRLIPWTNPMIHPSVMFRRQAIIAVGSYDARLRYAEDYDLWFRCIAGGLKFANLPDCLLAYRVGGSNFKKRGWAYRKTEILVRLNGCKALGLNTVRWISALIPLGLYGVGLIREQYTRFVYSLAKKLDPREHSPSMVMAAAQWLKR